MGPAMSFGLETFSTDQKRVERAGGGRVKGVESLCGSDEDGQD